jgi:hypothetical protein
MTTGDDDDGDIEVVGGVVTLPVPRVSLGTILALEDCDRDRQIRNSIRMIDRTSQLRAAVGHVRANTNAAAGRHRARVSCVSYK